MCTMQLARPCPPAPQPSTPGGGLGIACRLTTDDGIKHFQQGLQLIPLVSSLEKTHSIAEDARNTGHWKQKGQQHVLYC